jgi:hypothetical protein
MLTIYLNSKYNAANSILCTDYLPFPIIASQTYTRAMVCPHIQAPSELRYTPETSVRVCLTHIEPLRSHCGHCAESSAHYGRRCYEDDIR